MYIWLERGISPPSVIDNAESKLDQSKLQWQDRAPCALMRHWHSNQQQRYILWKWQGREMKMDLVLSAILGLLITFLVCNKWMLFIHVIKVSSNRWFHVCLNMECHKTKLVPMRLENFQGRSTFFYFVGWVFISSYLNSLSARRLL